jgi:aminomethyltransferase
LEAELRKTVLNDVHRKLGARMVDFGGWEMPIQYTGPIDEHLAVRNAAGIFDVSHMGEIEVKGPQALDLVQRTTSNDASRLVDGQAQYSALTTPQGTFVDDILVHRFGPEHFFLCVNASNSDKDAQWLSRASADFQAEVTDTGSRYTQLAIQGPLALEILQPLTTVDLAAIKYYWFTQGTVDGVPSIIARTGYTGEDGFEIYFDPSASERIWAKILEAGKPHGLRPCGLAARNTLRLEARMALYGHDIDETTTAYEADLGWIVKLNKGDFIGRDKLADQKTTGIRRKLVGFEMVDRGIARDGHIVFVNGEPKGHVTSGSPAPYLKKNIGLTYLPIRLAEPGTRLNIDIRGKMVAAEVVPTPFYKRAK